MSAHLHAVRPLIARSATQTIAPSSRRGQTEHMSAESFRAHLETIRGKSLTLFAGAGLSLWHPSSLPTWSEFNQVLLEKAKERALQARPMGTEVARALRDLKIDDVGSKAFSNQLVEILAGESYFDMVRALDAKRPNEAHRAVARLVRRGIVRAIITTNFDTLIERALKEERVPYVCYARNLDYSRKKQPGCPIYKIHGSAGPEQTLIDTVGQKLRGLPSYVLARLAKLYRSHHVVVLGYSGGDLEFGADYLALRCVPTRTPASARTAH